MGCPQEVCLHIVTLSLVNTVVDAITAILICLIVATFMHYILAVGWGGGGGWLGKKHVLYAHKKAESCGPPFTREYFCVSQLKGTGGVNN